MKRRIGILVAIAGIILIAYPLISNILAFFNQTEAVLTYQETVTSMTEEEIEAEKEKIKQYNNELTTESITIDDENNGAVEGVSYLNVLDIGDVIGYVSIPLIDVYLPIYHGTSDDVLQAGIGHLEESSFPIGEMGTHAVFLGHTGLVRTKMFDDLDKLEIGDKFYIYILDEKYCYQVDQIVTVLPDDLSEYTQIYEDQEYVTLVTCTPYGINSHRLLVRGTRIEDDEETSIEEDNEIINSKIDRYKAIITFIGIILVLLLLILIILRIKNFSKKYKGKHYINE